MLCAGMICDSCGCVARTLPVPPSMIVLPDAQAPVPPAGLPSSMQELACLHVDLLVAYFRMELALGVEDLKDKAATSTARLLATISKRDKQAAIFGTRTTSEMKRDEAKVAKQQQVRRGLGQPSNLSSQSRPMQHLQHMSLVLHSHQQRPMSGPCQAHVRPMSAAHIREQQRTEPSIFVIDRHAGALATSCPGLTHS
jgi:hypothetical protein